MICKKLGDCPHVDDMQQKFENESEDYQSRIDDLEEELIKKESCEVCATCENYSESILLSGMRCRLTLLPKKLFNWCGNWELSKQ
jgi:hypothetical protein